MLAIIFGCAAASADGASFTFFYLRIRSTIACRLTCHAHVCFAHILLAPNPFSISLSIYVIMIFACWHNAACKLHLKHLFDYWAYIIMHFPFSCRCRMLFLVWVLCHLHANERGTDYWHSLLYSMLVTASLRSSLGQWWPYRGRLSNNSLWNGSLLLIIRTLACLEVALSHRVISLRTWLCSRRALSSFYLSRDGAVLRRVVNSSIFSPQTHLATDLAVSLVMGLFPLVSLYKFEIWPRILLDWLSVVGILIL